MGGKSVTSQFDGLVDRLSDESECGEGIVKETTESYTVKVYTHYGYFSYEVSEMSSAIEHAQVIMERGVYRRSRGDGAVEFHKVIKTKVEGTGLASEYPDIFKRT